ncbi:glycosyltransferase family 4 protein [Micromonospora sp. DR5-3]|uniref:glycosyltransferase family 4 protein n=1 Tax=unclassified Micromonospora TaxID=2617518 RepID=UPI001652317D|nr:MULTISPECIES: glycosyltransferase family 4 protein [unclassified Micromonospora]MCW3814982.1 glycosyltransferase family 4 protein [Micromonospora sp. DR5-3]
MSRPRVLLLAPTSTTGGIASWAAILLDRARRTDFLVENTSRHFAVLGERETVRHRWLAGRAAVARVWRVLRRARAEAVDAVYVTSSPGLGFLLRDLPLALGLRLLRRPVVVHLHGGDQARLFGTGVLRRRFTLWALDRVSLVVVITRPIEHFLARRLANTPVRYLPNMLPDEYWAQACPPEPRRRDQGLTLALVAWQAAAKGTFAALHALALLPPDVRLLLVGQASAENAAAIEATVEELGLTARVVVTGPLDRAGVDATLARTDVLLLPSATEGFPMAVIEAMAHAVPVVATRVGAIAEMVGETGPEPCGLLVTARPEDPRCPADPAELADAVRRLSSAPGLAAALGAAGRRRVGAHYLVSVVLPELEDLIAAVASGHSVSRSAGAGTAVPPARSDAGTPRRTAVGR